MYMSSTHTDTVSIYMYIHMYMYIHVKLLVLVDAIFVLTLHVMLWLFLFTPVFQQKDSSENVSQSSGVDTNPTFSQSDGDCEGLLGSKDEEDSDDPDKLWCICQQPHNDRYVQ